jgi:hypothetical protein
LDYLSCYQEGSVGRLLVIAGLVLVAVGLLVMAAGRMGFPLGRLPGDISYRGKHVSVWVPLGTSLLLSVLLSLVLYLVGRFRR